MFVLSPFLSYFTNWVIFLVVFHTWTHEYVDLFFLTLIVLALSTYILYVANGHFVYFFNSTTVQLDKEDTETIFVHVVFHVVPFIFVTYLYFDYYMSNFDSERYLLTVLLVLAYLTIVDYEFMYGIDGPEVPLTGVAIVLSYLAFSNLVQSRHFSWTHV